jgi:uncharacterized protein YndB with AHSA1/START domain
MNQPSVGEVITKKIYIQCRPETLFQFFTDPDKMVRWMGGQVLMEPRIGGKYRIDINGHNNPVGTFVEVLPFKKIILTWGWEHSKLLPPGSSTVEFCFHPQDGGTHLTIKHSDLPDEHILLQRDGWTHYINRLHILAVGHDPGIDPHSFRGGD